VKIDHGTYKGMHSVLALKLGVTSDLVRARVSHISAKRVRLGGANTSQSGGDRWRAGRRPETQSGSGEGCVQDRMATVRDGVREIFGGK
jgi:hypothetical protein